MTHAHFKYHTLALAIAMTAPMSVADDSIEEVIVTATARAQAAEDIPFNISAVQGDDIKQQQIVDSADLMRTIPGVSLVDRGARNGGIVNSMIIRGINVDSGATGDVGNNAVPTVATYIDSTPLFANFLIKDVERVEVLRGPQGTLYGSGALGGTVRYITNKPDASEFDASFNTTFSQTDGSDDFNNSVDMMVNVPLSENAAVRISAGRIDNAGTIDYVNLYQLDTNGVPVVAADDGSCKPISQVSNAELVGNGGCYTSKEDADTVEITYARAALKIDPTENLSILASYHHQEDDVGARRSMTDGIDGWGNEYDDYENGSTFLEPSKAKSSLASLEVQYDLGFATLTSTTSSYDTNTDGWRDNTSLWVSGGRDWFNAWYTGMPRPASHVEAGVAEEAFVQEIRLVSNVDESSNIDWVVGAYYMDQDRETYNYSHMRGLVEYGEGQGWWDSANFAHDIDFFLNRQETFTDKAVYGELTYHLADNMRVTGGLRWFDNELTNDTAINAFIGQPANLPYIEYPTQTEDDVLTKLNFSYDLSDQAMVYATYSEGFRRGGPNSIPTDGFFAELNPQSVEQYGKDTVKNYEIGIKGVTETMRYSADIYYVDWQDPQLNTATAWWGFFMAQNGESARTQGVEVELLTSLSPSIDLQLGYSYTDAELTADLVQPQTGGVIAEDGQRLPGTAEQIITVGLIHSTQINGMDLVSRINGYYQSDSTNYISETSSLQAEHDGFSLWSANSTLVMDQWTMSLYAKNLLNEEGVTGNYPSAYMSNDTGAYEYYFGNNQRQYITQPRTIGLSLGYSF